MYLGALSKSVSHAVSEHIGDARQHPFELHVSEAAHALLQGRDGPHRALCQEGRELLQNGLLVLVEASFLCRLPLERFLWTTLLLTTLKHGENQLYG